MNTHAAQPTSVLSQPCGQPLQRRRLLQASAAALVLPTAITSRAQTGPIVLGQSAPFTGAAAQLGIQFNNGAQLAFDAINAAGGIAGRNVELRTLDDGYEPEKTAANTKTFLNANVFALFGYIGTPTSLAALPLATEAKCPFFAPFTGAQALREPFNRYAIHVRASYFDETGVIVRQALALGSKRIAVFHQNDAYGKTGLEGVTRALAAANAKPIATGTVERNSVDVAAAVKAIMAESPEAIVQISAYRSCAAFVREARKAGFGGTFYNVSFVGTTALANELGKDAVGVVVSQVMPFPYAPHKVISGEYLAALKAANKPDLVPNYSGIEGYVAARVFAEAAKRSRAASRESFIDAIEGMRNFDLGGLLLNFSTNKHVGSQFVELTMLTAEGKVRR